MSLNAAIRAEAEALVKEQMAHYDPSHDWLHVDRVRRQGKGTFIHVRINFFLLFPP